MYTVLFIGETSLEQRDHIDSQLKNIPNVTALYTAQVDEDALKLAPKADIIVTGFPPLELLDAATKLKLHIVPFAGVQQVIDTFRNINQTRDIALVNAHWNDYHTAQHMVALLLALTNRLIHYHRNVEKGKWRVFENGMASITLRDRKVGLLGYGRVNKLVHRFLAGFDVEFGILKRTWNESLSTLPTAIKKYNVGELHSFLSWSDILLIALPMTPETERLIKINELKLLGRDGLVVNVSRGKLIDEADFYTALEEGVIAGAGIDVWYNYRPEADTEGRKYPYEPAHPFHKLQNVVLSPHRGASPIKSLHRWDEVIENIRRFAAGEELINVVDLDAGY